MQRTDGQSEQSLDVFPNEKIVTHKLPSFIRELSREECIELGKYIYYKIGLSIRYSRYISRKRFYVNSIIKVMVHKPL